MSLREAPAEIYDHFSTAAANIIKYFDDEERNKMLSELRENVERNCVLDTKLRKSHEIMQRLGASQIDNNTDDNEEEAEPQHEDEMLKRYDLEISSINTNVSRHQKLLEHDQQVQALLNDANQRQGCASDDNDEELLLTQNEMNVIDPISKTRMTDPVKNTACGHVYDRESVTSMLQTNRKTRCPVVGCKSKGYILLENLKTDVVTRAYLARNKC